LADRSQLYQSNIVGLALHVDQLISYMYTVQCVTQVFRF